MPRFIERAELEENVTTYVRWIAGSGMPDDIGFAVVLFPKANPEMGVTGGNVPPELLAAVLRKAEKRCKDRRIVGPEGLA